MRRADLHVAAMVALAWLAACVNNPAPKGWLQPAPLSESDPYGAWIELRPTGAQPHLAGEFLAVDRDSVFVLDAHGFVTATATADVRSARIAFYNPLTAQLVAWNTLGTLSTLSHGAFLVVTAPLLWGTVGSLIVANNSRLPIVDVKTPNQWPEATKYARFPTGLPPDLPRTLPVKR